MLEAERDHDTFRILWVAGIALARTVGDVLDKVDARTDHRLETIIRDKYSEWKQDKQKSRVFWDFIREERNRVVHEYEFGFLAGPIGVVASNESFTLDEQLFCPLSDGAFAGEDCRDVLESAIQWWERELFEIEDLYLRTIQ